LPAAALAAMALTGCENFGESGVSAELSRVRGQKNFSIISSTAQRAMFSAQGQQIVVEPPQGYCLDEGSVAVTGKAAFALIADCLENGQPELLANAGEGEVVEIELPRSFPGILTVSISGEPAYGAEPGGLDRFEALLGTPAGLTLLGRGNSPKSANVNIVRRIGNALYVLVEEQPGAGGAILGPRFSRAFIDINDRLVLVTVSSFIDRPTSDEAMLGFLARQIARLRQANGMIADGEEGEIAGGSSGDVGEGGVRVIRSETGAATSDGTDPLRAPMPLRRDQAAADRGGDNAVGVHAPPRAPSAPRRPGAVRRRGGSARGVARPRVRHGCRWPRAAVPRQ